MLSASFTQFLCRVNHAHPDKEILNMAGTPSLSCIPEINKIVSLHEEELKIKHDTRKPFHPDYEISQEISNDNVTPSHHNFGKAWTSAKTTLCPNIVNFKDRNSSTFWMQVQNWGLDDA